MLIRSIQIRNLLSFGPDTPPFEMRPLNVLIGANGSGKSNFFEALALLGKLPATIGDAVFELGPAREILFRPEENGAKPHGSEFSIETVFDAPEDEPVATHRIALASEGHFWVVAAEHIRLNYGGESLPLVSRDREAFGSFSHVDRESTPANETSRVSELALQTFAGEWHFADAWNRDYIARMGRRSAMSFLQDPKAYPAVLRLADGVAHAATFRDWTFGRRSPLRQNQSFGQPDAFLSETGDNFVYVLAGILPEIKESLLKQVRRACPAIRDIYTKPVGNALALFVQEGRREISQWRMSDGTLRYLMLLTILLHPKPPALVCIDEPEIGLHPDALVGLADAIRDASTRTQIVVGTHSELLVEFLGEDPECIVAFDKYDGATVMERKSREELASWLQDYNLGQLWAKGVLGGNVQ